MVVNTSNRRGFLRKLASGATGASLAGTLLSKSAAAQTGSTPESGPLEVNKLADNFLEITGAGANVLAVMGADGVLLVNGGSADRSAELLKLISERSGGKPVQVL
ncbi:MAG: hypothetical protein JOZ32_06265, partial [Bryobacterales bacterium]|nr:hypothetical protein [Bryobacterales bacterium]